MFTLPPTPIPHETTDRIRELAELLHVLARLIGASPFTAAPFVADAIRIGESTHCALLDSTVSNGHRTLTRVGAYRRDVSRARAAAVVDDVLDMLATVDTRGVTPDIAARLDDVAARLVAIVDEQRPDAPPIRDTATAKAQSHAPQWRRVIDELERLQRDGQIFPRVRVVASKLQCAKSTVSDAIKSHGTDRLRQWVKTGQRLRAEARRSQPHTATMTAGVQNRLADTHGHYSAAECDEALEEIIAKATPEQAQDIRTRPHR